jgi:outer membrane protein assembly factor BamA
VETAGNVFFSSNYLLRDAPEIKSQQDAERLIFKVLEQYNNTGFPFCKVFPEMVEDDGTLTKLILTIDEGPRVIIDDLLFKTDGKTDAGAAKRLANFKMEEYFSIKKVQRTKKRLMRTGAFKNVDERVLGDDGRYYLMLKLIERESDLLTLSGSLSEENRDFGASFSSSNLLGTLRRLDFEYEYQRLFSLEFQEPVLIAPAQLDADFSILTYDSTRLIAGHVRFAAPIGEYFRISLLSGIEVVNRYEDDSVTYQTSDNLLGIGLGFDHTGEGWSTKHDIGLDYLFRTADRLKFAYDGDFWLQKMVFRVHHRYVKTDEFDFFDYIRIGGARDLRGYLEDEFTAKTASWINVEYHRLFFFPLLDIARIDGNIVFAYGFGISAESRIADASLVLAWPERGTWSDGKIHLTIAKGF